MSGSGEPFPWEEVLHLALARLRWTPQVLWHATPRELAFALAPAPAGAAQAADLRAMMMKYPDGHEV